MALVSLFYCSAAAGGQRTKVFVTSSIDGTKQPCYVIVPDDYDPQGDPVPLLVSLHTWSGGVEQRQAELERLVEQEGWIYLFPHFRGPNLQPDAGGSEKAQQDILDSVAWARKTYNVDSRRVYLTGTSGGGHMSLLMAGRHPEVWAAVSAWVGISDFAAWHTRHANDQYGEMIRRCCGGPPGASPEIDRQYRERSPLTYLHRAATLPVDIAAGIHDGHRGSVPIRHSLDAFNKIAIAVGERPITEAEIEQLSRSHGHLEHPMESDGIEEPALGRKIYLRRAAGESRVTIFEGGHESVPAAAIEWLKRHAQPE